MNLDTCRVSIPSSVAGLERLVDALGAFARNHHIPDPVTRNLHLALDEVLSNIIQHAYGGDPSHEIEVTFTPETSAVVIEVIDNAPPFDLRRHYPASQQAELTLKARPVGGLGLLLVKQLINDVRYERRGGRNHLHLRIPLDEDGAGPHLNPSTESSKA